MFDFPPPMWYSSNPYHLKLLFYVVVRQIKMTKKFDNYIFTTIDMMSTTTIVSDELSNMMCKGMEIEI